MVSQHVDSALVFLDRLSVTGVNQVISLAHAIDELIMARDEPRCRGGSQGESAGRNAGGGSTW